MPNETVPVIWADRYAIAALPAEIDASNADQIGTGLLRVLGRQPSILVVDMTSATICDCAGLHAIMRAHQRAAGCGAQLRLVVSAGAVQRVLTLIEADRIIAIYPSVDAALDGLTQPPPVGTASADGSGGRKPGGAAAAAPQLRDGQLHDGQLHDGQRYDTTTEQLRDGQPHDGQRHHVQDG